MRCRTLILVTGNASNTGLGFLPGVVAQTLDIELSEPDAGSS